MSCRRPVVTLALVLATFPHWPLGPSGPGRQPKTDPVRDLVVALPKHTHSIYDSRAALREQGRALSMRSLWGSLRAAGAGFATEVGGVLLLVPLLVELGFDRPVEQAGHPGTRAIPARQSLLALLALKLLWAASASAT